MTSESRSRFGVLFRTFFAQFFVSQSAASELQLHQTMVWVMVFLLVPGVFALIQLFPEFQSAVILAHLGRAPITVIDDYLAWISFFLTTYVMVAVGFLTILAWDALSFDRRDAMVLGSLPVPPRTLIAAKLSALTALLMLVSLSISALNAVMFALVTSDQLGPLAFVRHLVAMFIAGAGSGLFIFAAIVTLRGVVLRVGGPGLADACGPPLQFICVVLVLCLMLLSPAVWQVPFMTASLTGWMPSAWFVGVFEHLRHSPRASDPAFPFHVYTERATIGTCAVVGAAALLSIVEFRHQLVSALASARTSRILGRAYVSRLCARVLSGRNRRVRAIGDFTLLTLARSRRQQLPVALNAAVGAACIIVALSRDASSFDVLLRTRTAILWIPLVMSYWMAAGLRSAFFTTSEPAAAWVFRSHPAVPDLVRWRAVRAAMAGFVLPRGLVLSIAIIPAIGWKLALWHTAIVATLTMGLVGVMACGVSHVPFTRAFEPGHARLRTKWIFYAAGLYVFAYWPSRIELLVQHRPRALATLLVTAVALAVGVEIVAALWPRNMSATTEETYEEEAARLSVLDLAGAVNTAARV